MKIGLLKPSKSSNKILHVVDRGVYVIGHDDTRGMRSPILLDEEGFNKVREAFASETIAESELQDNVALPDGPIAGLTYVGEDLAGAHIHVGKFYGDKSILRVKDGNNYGSTYWSDTKLPDPEEVKSSDIFYSVNTGDQSVYCERCNYLKVIYPNGTSLEFRHVKPVKENKFVLDSYLESEVSDKSEGSLLAKLFPLQALDLIRYEGPFGESNEVTIAKDVVDYIVENDGPTKFTVRRDSGEEYSVEGFPIKGSHIVCLKTDLREIPYRLLTKDLQVPLINKMTKAFEGASYSTVDDYERKALTSSNLMNDGNTTSHALKIYKDGMHIDTLKFVSEALAFLSLQTRKLYL